MRKRPALNKMVGKERNLVYHVAKTLNQTVTFLSSQTFRVSYTACLSSFIFQQYRNGLREEFNKSKDIVTAHTRLRAGLSTPMITIKAVEDRD